jgi:hypothetical protein
MEQLENITNEEDELSTQATTDIEEEEEADA